MPRRVCLLVGLVLAACQPPPVPPAAVPPAGPQVAVRAEPGLRQTHFTIESGDCQIAWTLHAGEIDRGVIVQRPRCSWPLERQVPLLTALLEKILAVSPEKPRALSWGRLTPDGPHDPTLSLRLAQAAARSPDWNAAAGRPRSGDPNAFVVQLANNPPIYGELIALFRAKGLDLRLTSVEKVLVFRAADLPYFSDLEKAGVRGRDKLPFDCQTWFSLTPS